MNLNLNLSLGTIVSFNSPKVVSFYDLKRGLAYAGLSEDLAREILPQHAFKRACKSLSKNRVIDVVEENKDEIKFQFTTKEVSAGYAAFHYEQVVTVNKSSGCVYAGTTEFQNKAQQLLDHEMAIRHGGDVTRLVHKIFDSHGGDLIKIRPQGGAYFVPQTHAHLVNNLAVLMSHIGGVLVSYEIGGDSPTTRESVAQNMYDHFKTLLRDFGASCEALTTESSDEAKLRREQDLLLIRTKLEAYKDLMSQYSKEISESIAHAETEMHQRLFEGVFDEPSLEPGYTPSDESQNEPMGVTFDESTEGPEVATNRGESNPGTLLGGDLGQGSGFSLNLSGLFSGMF
jgi:hypothetical protein